MAHWKFPNPDGVHGFWYKKLTELHGRVAAELQKLLASGTVPEWETVGRNVLIIKDAEKRTVPNNYIRIKCQPFMWNLLTGYFMRQNMTTSYRTHV